MFFLGKTAIGLDIDDLSLELVELQHATGGAKILASSRVALPSGLIEHGLIKDEAKLGTIISQLFDGAQPKKIKPGNIVFGLPHSQFYPALVELPVSESKQLINAIWQAAYTNLPFEANDLLLEYKILERTSNYIQVLLIGTSKKYILSWQRLLAKIGVIVDMFDISSYALWRDLVADDQDENVAVIDIGAAKTNLFVFRHGQLNYSYDFDIGGDSFTNHIADKFKLTPEVAEAKKIKLGLNRQIFPIVENLMQDLTKEVSVALADYETKTGQQVASIKLVGGGANLKGIINYFKEKISIPSGLGQLKSMKAGTDCLFVEACGLALRGLNPDAYKDQPQLILSSDKPTASLALPIIDEIVSKEEPVKIMPEEKKPEPVITNKPLMVSEDNDEEPIARVSNIDKFNLEKKLLIIILLIGALAVGAAYWYRSNTKAKQLKIKSAPVVAFSEVQSFPYKITVAVNSSAYSAQVVKGRIIDDKILTGNDFNEVLNISRRKITAELKPEEELWPDPLNEVIDKTKVSYPITFRWLAINKQEALKLALAEIDKINSEKLPYEFNAITKTKVEKTDSLDTVYLYGEITVSLNRKIATLQIVDLSSLATVTSTSTSTASTTIDTIVTSTVTEPASSTSMTVMPIDPVTKPSEPVEQTVGDKVAIIGETETGWLNVRRGPGKNFEILAKIYPGESYQFVKKEAEWIQITLKDSTLGWILGKYASLSP